jgi:ASC-1-like (ASCH) protein
MKRIKFNFTFTKSTVALAVAIQRYCTFKEVYSNDGLQLEHFVMDRHTLDFTVMILWWQFGFTIIGRKVKEKK